MPITYQDPRKRLQTQQPKPAIGGAQPPPPKPPQIGGAPQPGRQQPATQPPQMGYDPNRVDPYGGNISNFIAPPPGRQPPPMGQQYPGAPQQPQQEGWGGFGGLDTNRPGGYAPGQESRDAQAAYQFGQMGTQNQYANLRATDIDRLPISEEMKNTLRDQRYIDQLRPQAGQLPNTAEYFNPNVQGAQGQIGGIFGGQGLYGGPQDNPFLRMGQQMLGGMSGQAPGMPKAPGIQGAPTQYDPKLQFGGPQMGQFDPNQVQGPKMPGIGGAGGDYGGPQTGVPGFNELVKLGQGIGGPQNLPREQMGQVGIGGSDVSSQAFQDALRASQGLATSDVDASGLTGALKTAGQDAFQQAARAGMGMAGARGFSDPGGTIAGGEMGRELSAAATQFGTQTQEALMAAQAQQAQQRATGAGQLAGLGGASAGALQGQQGLQLQQNLGMGGLGVQQRGQDVDMARLGMQGGAQGMQGIADLVRARSGAGIGEFQAGTERGLGQGRLGLEGQRLAQEGALGGYQAQTGRMQTQGDIYNQGMQNQIGGYQAATQRGLGAGQIGLGYDQLGAANQNQFNQQQIDLYGQQGQQAIGQYGAQTDRYGTMLGGAQGFAGTQQAGGMEAGRQQLQAGQLANQILQGGAAGQQAFNQMQMGAAQGDQNMIMQMTELYRTGEIQKYMGRKQESAAAWGALGSGLGMAGQVGAAMAGG